MDNCPSHVTDDIIALLTEARLRVTTFAQYTTQIFQVLDVTLFGVLKRRLGYELPFEEGKEKIHNEGISRLQADNGGAQHMRNFSGDWV
jgi:D-lyxose ketol-isomerase